MRLTRNFKLSEFTFSETAIRLGIPNRIPSNQIPNVIRLAKWLQTFRDRLCKEFGKDMPIVITSGYRCVRLNKAVRGSRRSMHMQALAADFHVVGLSVAQTQRLIIELMQDCPYDQCIDEYSGWIHLGLSADGDIPRMENLLARKRVNWRGKTVTEYLDY